jgi:hypothetical protein
MDDLAQRDKALKLARDAARDGNATLARLMLTHARDFAAPTPQQVKTVEMLLEEGLASRRAAGALVRDWL